MSHEFKDAVAEGIYLADGNNKGFSWQQFKRLAGKYEHAAGLLKGYNDMADVVIETWQGKTADLHVEVNEWLRAWRRARDEGYPIELKEGSLDYYVNLLYRLEALLSR